MAIPRIIYSDLSTVTYAADLGNTSATHLNNYLVSSYWTAGSTSDTYVYIDMGSSVSITDIVIDGHNLNGATVSLARSATSNMASPTVVANLTNGFVNGSPYQQTFDTATSRYWGLYIHGNPVAPIIGNLFLGNAVVFTTPYDGAFKAENAEFNISSKTSLSGIKRGSKNYKGRLVYELKFSYQTTALKTSFQLFTRTVCGSQYPFYFVSADGIIRYMNLDANYVPVTTVAHGYHSIDTLVMKTNESIY